MIEDSVLRAFEAGGLLIYLAALVCSLRTRSAYFVGIFASCNLYVFWDWIFNTVWFFNVTFNAELTALWTIAGERETLAAVLAFVGFYYWVVHLLTRYAEVLDARFGRWQYPLLYIASCIYVLVFETLFVNLGVWTYWQKPEYEFYGVAWSNAFFNAHIIILCYLLLRYFWRWAQLDDVRSLDVRQESFWKPFVLSASAVQAGTFVAFSIQMLWYIATQPWVESPRLF